MTISDRTRLSFSIAQMAIVGGLIASVAVSWTSERSERQAHQNNTHVHLDEHFGDVHGVPVGQNDVAAMAAQNARAFEALDNRVKRIEENEATAAQRDLDRKPRWRP